MKKLLISILCLLNLAGCANFNSSMQKVEAECTKQNLPNRIAYTECLRTNQEQVVAKYYPAIIPEFDSFADKRSEAARKRDANEITDSNVRAICQQAYIVFMSYANNYKAVSIEKKKQAYCASMGAPIGSDKYYDCRKWIEQELASEIAQQNQAAIASIPLVIQQPQAQPVYNMQVPNLMPHTTNCITTGSGNSLLTTCR